MGKGIVGPIIDTVPGPDGRPLVVRDAGQVDGVTCEIHNFTPEQLLANHAFLAMIASPKGVDACRPCIERFLEYAREHRPELFRR